MALLSSLENAETGSRELSDRVLAALGYKYSPIAEKYRCDYLHLSDRDFESAGYWMHENGGPMVPGRNPSVSLDDALELVGNEWRTITAHHRADGAWRWALIWSDVRSDEQVEGYGPTPALALCSALLEAKTSAPAESEASPKIEKPNDQ